MSDITERLHYRLKFGSAVIGYSDMGVTLETDLQEAVDEIERLRRAVNKMAAAAGPAWTPRWVLDAPWSE